MLISYADLKKKNTKKNIDRVMPKQSDLLSNDQSFSFKWIEMFQIEQPTPFYFHKEPSIHLSYLSLWF